MPLSSQLNYSAVCPTVSLFRIPSNFHFTGVEQIGPLFNFLLMQVVFSHCHASAKGVQSVWDFLSLPLGFLVFLNLFQVLPLVAIFGVPASTRWNLYHIRTLVAFVFNLSFGNFAFFTSLGNLTGLNTFRR